MQKIKLGEQFNKPIVVALGFFDCMHKGHMSLLERAKQLANQFGCQSAVFTFSNNHFKTLNRDGKLIYTFNERVEIYNSVGLDLVLYSNFDKQFMSLTADSFLEMLYQYHVKAIVCGFDYTCGSDMKGCEYVQKYAISCNTICDIVSQISYNDKKMSSTMIKDLLEQRKVCKVNSLLSEKYFIIGTVVSGRKVGRALGFPTANLQVDEDKLLVQGVYACDCEVDGVLYNGILNIGSKPTFDVDETGVEVHLKNFDGSLYGRQLKISLTKYLREIRKFDSKQELIGQLQQDLLQGEND